MESDTLVSWRKKYGRTGSRRFARRTTVSRSIVDKIVTGSRFFSRTSTHKYSMKWFLMGNWETCVWYIHYEMSEICITEKDVTRTLISSCGTKQLVYLAVLLSLEWSEIHEGHREKKQCKEMTYLQRPAWFCSMSLLHNVSIRPAGVSFWIGIGHVFDMEFSSFSPLDCRFSIDLVLNGTLLIWNTKKW